MICAAGFCLAALVALVGCGNGSPEPPPEPAELRVVWAGGIEGGEINTLHVFLVEPADGIAARGVLRDLRDRAEVFVHHEPAFAGGYYLDVRTDTSPVESICIREIRAIGGETVTATISQPSPHSCRIRISRD